MFPEILVPIALFFGMTVFMCNSMTATALKNIEHKRQPD